MCSIDAGRICPIDAGGICPIDAGGICPIDAGRKANSADLDQTALIQGCCCLFRSLCPKTWNFYGNVVRLMFLFTSLFPLSPVFLHQISPVDVHISFKVFKLIDIHILTAYMAAQTREHFCSGAELLLVSSKSHDLSYHGNHRPELKVIEVIG